MGSISCQYPLILKHWRRPELAHPAPTKVEALMPPLLLPQPLATALLIVFCRVCGNGKYSVARAAAGCLNQLYSQSQLSNFSQ